MNDSIFQHKNGTGKEISAWSIFSLILKKFHWLLLSGAAIALAVFFAVSFLVTPTYKSTATFYVYNSSNGVSTSGVINNNDLQAAESLTSTYSKIFQSNAVLDSVLQDLNYKNKLSRKELSEMVDVSIISDTQLLELSVTSPDPEFSCKVAKSFISIAPQEIVRIKKAGGVEVIDRPEVATEKSSPRTVFDTAIGFIVGIIIAFIIIVIRAVSDTTVYLSEDLESIPGLTVLGQIPNINVSGRYSYWSLKEGGVISYEKNIFHGYPTAMLNISEVIFICSATLQGI